MRNSAYYYRISRAVIGICFLLVGTSGCQPDQKSHNDAASQLSHIRIPCLPGASVRALPRTPAEIFVNSDDYPTTALPPYRAADYPWLKYDPRNENEWRNYLWEVLKYAYKGRVEVDWRMERCSSPWYHAPWMQRRYRWIRTADSLADKSGYGGREWVHGLTKEKPGTEFELTPSGSLNDSIQTWAVSLYNEPGGNTIGRAWRNICEKKLNDPVLFPPGTVAIKFLFTTASPTRVHYLNNGITWLANIDSADPDSLTPMHLLQIDIAVRDTQVDATTGWVFGAFVTMGDSAIQGPWGDTTSIVDSLRGWYRVRPLGLIWGNDTAAARDMALATKEQNIDTSLSNLIRKPLGWKGRFNGPADGDNSSCIGCHQQAQRPRDSTITFSSASSPFTGNKPDSVLMRYFLRNLRPEHAFIDTMVSLDYSLQLQTGIANYWNFRKHQGKFGRFGEVR